MAGKNLRARGSGKFARGRMLRRSAASSLILPVVALGLVACTPPDEISARVDQQDGVLEFATCEPIEANVIRVMWAEDASTGFRDVWIVVGEHRFLPGDSFVVGEELEGMRVLVDEPIKLGDDSRISVSIEQWPDSVEDELDRPSEIPGLPEKAIGFNFESAVAEGSWLRADDTLHENPCG